VPALKWHPYPCILDASVKCQPSSASLIFASRCCLGEKEQEHQIKEAHSLHAFALIHIAILTFIHRHSFAPIHIATLTLTCIHRHSPKQTHMSTRARMHACTRTYTHTHAHILTFECPVAYHSWDLRPLIWLKGKINC